MRTWARRTIGVLLAIGIVAGVGAVTRVEYTPDSAEQGMLRLAWRARVPLVEECRRLSEEEQAELPVHMRRETVCEGRVASYRLEVTVDGELRHRSLVSGAGARGDRPLYVFESLPLELGSHALQVEFTRTGAATDSSGQAAQEGAETVPARLALRRDVTVGAGDVVLVSYDLDRRELVIR